MTEIRPWKATSALLKQFSRRAVERRAVKPPPKAAAPAPAPRTRPSAPIPSEAERLEEQAQWRAKRRRVAGQVFEGDGSLFGPSSYVEGARQAREQLRKDLNR